MKDRMTLGHDADVAETAALTLRDDSAAQRIFDSADWEHVEREDAIAVKRDERRIPNAVQIVRRVLGNEYARVVNAWLRGKTWRDLGIPKATFHFRLKKVEKFFTRINIG